MHLLNANLTLKTKLWGGISYIIHNLLERLKRFKNSAIAFEEFIFSILVTVQKVISKHSWKQFCIKKDLQLSFGLYGRSSAGGGMSGWGDK